MAKTDKKEETKTVSSNNEEKKVEEVTAEMEKVEIKAE